MSWFRRKSKPEPLDPDEFPPEAKKALVEAVLTGQPPVFHGGCVSCVIRAARINTTLEGLRYCSTCKYFDADWDKPDRSVNIDVPAGGWSAQDFDHYLAGYRNK